MTDKEVLERCIEKAIDGGWKGAKWCMLDGDWLGSPPKIEVVDPFGIDAHFRYTTGGVNIEQHDIPLEHVIFNLDFAKALWKGHYSKGTQPYGVPKLEKDIWEWRYHLQQLAITEDRIDYLRKWLEGLSE